MRFFVFSNIHNPKSAKIPRIGRPSTSESKAEPTQASMILRNPVHSEPLILTLPKNSNKINKMIKRHTINFIIIPSFFLVYNKYVWKKKEIKEIITMNKMETYLICIMKIRERKQYGIF